MLRKLNADAEDLGLFLIGLVDGWMFQPALGT
jgi:hypothetical protein